MGRVLVIETDPSLRQSLEQDLGEAGHVVFAVADGAAGLRVLAERTIDLVLLEYDLPGMNGIALCEAIERRPEWRGIALVLMTAVMTAEIDAGLPYVGVRAVLVKPFDEGELSAAIAQLWPSPG